VQRYTGRPSCIARVRRARPNPPNELATTGSARRSAHHSQSPPWPTTPGRWPTPALLEPYGPHDNTCGTPTPERIGEGLAKIGEFVQGRSLGAARIDLACHQTVAFASAKCVREDLM
jgi:hypothetical protein